MYIQTRHLQLKVSIERWVDNVIILIRIRTVTDQEIVQLLQKVRLSHLSGLVKSYDTVYGQEWSKMLSPGEQQRLVFARIFYWKPRFAGMFSVD